MARYRQSGPISLEEVAEFFGETPSDTHSLDNYYRGGTIVPSQGPTGGQAAIHNIRVGNPNEFIIYLTGNSGNYTGQTHTYTDAGPTSFSIPRSSESIQIPGSDTINLAADTTFRGMSFEYEVLEPLRTGIYGFGFSDGTVGTGVSIAGTSQTGLIAIANNNDFTLPAGNAFFAYASSTTAPTDFRGQNLTIQAFEEDVAVVRISNIPERGSQPHDDLIVSVPASLTTDETLSQALLTSLNARRAITDHFTVTRELTMVPEIDPNNNVWIVRLVGTDPNATYLSLIHI